MAVIRKIANKNPEDPQYFRLHCPGCNRNHVFKTSGPSPVWQFNGDLDKPTLQPSLVVSYGATMVCHSFITDGKIQFLGDSWHDLKNKTVPMVEI